MDHAMAVLRFRIGGWGRPLCLLLTAYALGSAPLPKLAAQEGPPSLIRDEATQEEAEALREEAEQQVLEDTVFVDPLAAELMENRFEPLYRNVPRARTSNLIRQMAQGGVGLNPAMIERHVKGAARDLTNRDNIQGYLEGGELNAPDIRALEEAGQDLLAPYLIPEANRDSRFYREYNRQLLAVAPELLNNHLIARSQVMLALSRMGDRAALPLLIEALNNPEQPVAVKMLAAVGVTTIARDTRNQLSSQERVEAARGLIRFLERHPDALWLARARAIEAIGTLRQVSGIQNVREAEMATTALQLLTNPNARLETRAWTAWSLGMLEPAPTSPPINYSLVAYQIGRLAEDIGDEILRNAEVRGAILAEARARTEDEEEELAIEEQLIDPELERVRYLTGFLTFQVFKALDGESWMRDSGLRNARGLGEHRRYVMRVHDLVRRLAAAAVQYTKGVGVQEPGRRRALADELAQLKAFLDANPPDSPQLVPDGPAFELAAD